MKGMLNDCCRRCLSNRNKDLIIPIISPHSFTDLNSVKKEEDQKRLKPPPNLQLTLVNPEMEWHHVTCVTWSRDPPVTLVPRHYLYSGYYRARSSAAVQVNKRGGYRDQKYLSKEQLL